MSAPAARETFERNAEGLPLASGQFAEFGGRHRRAARPSQRTDMDSGRAIGASRRTVASSSMSPLVSRLRSIGSKVDSSITAPCACAAMAKLRAFLHAVIGGRDPHAAAERLGRDGGHAQRIGAIGARHGQRP